MSSIQFYRWILDIDVEATRQAYKIISEGNADKCACDGCKNFALQKEHVYPPIVREFFNRAGIDYLSEIESARICKLTSGKHSYLGWFFCFGRIVSDTHSKQKTTKRKHCTNETQYVRVTDDFIISIRPQSSYKIDAFQGPSVLEIDYYVDIPWVAQTPEPAIN